jgi:hypothetical protein
MSADDHLAWLMEWYVAQCDEDWEHTYGVAIDTLDNPGWSLTVDLCGTPLERRPFVPVYENVGDEEPVQGLDGDVSWVVCKVEDLKFKGYSGPRDLGRLVSIFRRWATE